MKNNSAYSLSNITNVIEKFKLEYYYDILLTKNTANNLPYHNLNHTLSVIMFCYELADMQKGIALDVRNLLISAMMHDFNHSGGVLTDEENVTIAIDAFINISKEDKESNNKIVANIKATQYPYVLDQDSLSLEQLIIRDADLLQGVRDDYHQQVIIGLSTEFKQDLKSFMPNQIKFWNSAKYHTQHANRLWNSVKESRIEDATKIAEILTSTKK